MNKQVPVSDWADVQIFLAIHECQTLSNAALRLGLSQPTVGRRLSALEKRLGIQLFSRAGRALTLTESGEAILENARKMDLEMQSIRRIIDGKAHSLSGEVTISALEGTGSQWLIPVLGEMKKTYPDITVELTIDSRPVNLLRREADIALRMGQLTELDLIAKKLVDVEFGFFAAEEYVAKNGMPASLDDLSSLEWVRVIYGSSRRDMLMAFCRQHELTPRVAMNTDSGAAQLEAIVQGMGAGVLSLRWANTQPNLVRLLPEVSVASIDLWLVSHEDLRYSARIKAVADFIAAAAEKDRRLFCTK